MIALVEAEVQREGKLSIERRYFLRNINDKASIRARRKALAWDDQYLANAINGT